MSLSFHNLIYWKNAMQTVATFLSGLIVLLALYFYSVLEVLSCIAIPSLVITMAMRIIYYILNMIFKENFEHPFKIWLKKDLNLSKDKIELITQRICDGVNATIQYIKRILFVDEFIPSLKALVVLFGCHYVGRKFSGLTLIFLCYIGVFFLPKLLKRYEKELCDKATSFRICYQNLYTRISTIITEKAGKKYANKEN
ncbi:uncharacterized protein LOC105848480 isoform X1 [Hydra vulgaris]|uniref:uncharacterized protein LOC105848480 isoform X1 n=1 Tax=Hydra vulgaris TaxID=6087 RepID=UPI001F5FB729|nr:uncharacterized protein LOC105848480 [Hydra vulgaris]